MPKSFCVAGCEINEHTNPDLQFPALAVKGPQKESLMASSYPETQV